jgi:hypothetical protein
MGMHSIIGNLQSRKNVIKENKKQRVVLTSSLGVSEAEVGQCGLSSSQTPCHQTINLTVVTPG